MSGEGCRCLRTRWMHIAAIAVVSTVLTIVLAYVVWALAMTHLVSW